FLLAYDFFAAIHPLAHVLASFTAAVLKILFAFLGAVPDGFARLFAGAGSIKNAQQGPKSQSRQKPHKAVTAISVRHRVTSRNPDGNIRSGRLQIEARRRRERARRAGEREPAVEIPSVRCERSLSSCSRGPFVLAPPSGLRNEQGDGEWENRQSVVIIIRFVSLRFSCTMKRFSGRPTSDRANMMGSVARISGSLISLSTFSVAGCEIF